MKSRLYITLLFLLALAANSFAQNAGDVIIQGTVSASSNGELLPGVNIQELNSENRIVNATITDANGHYVIRLKNPNDKLTFSYLGFEKTTRAVNNQKVINVALQETGHTMKEVTVTAKKMYGDGGFKIPEREITTAVQTINAKAFEGLQVGSIDEALQGRIAGLDIVSNSGDIGAGTTMRIRGASTIKGNTTPLIVVNGVPYNVSIDNNFDFANANQEQYANMLSINPDDILEISVLKDAASTAIWGLRGANGVLVVTTKKGAIGPTKLQYTYRLTRAVQPKGMKLLNGDDYTMLMKQAYFNPNQDENASDIDEYNYDPSFSEFENFNNNTDWVKEVTQTGYINDHYVTLSGGGERALFRISGGYYDQVGTIIGQKLNRYSARAYLDYSVSDRLKFIAEFSYSNTDFNRSYEDLLGMAYRKMPNVSVYRQDGNGNNTSDYYNISTSSKLKESQRDMHNPVAIANLAKNNLKNYRIIPTFRLRYDMTDEHSKNLEYNMYVSLDKNNDKVSKFLPWEATNIKVSGAGTNVATGEDNESFVVQTDNNISWTPKFEDTNHNLMLFGSFQADINRYSGQAITSSNLISSVSDPSQGGYLSSMGNSTSSSRSLAFTARAHYSYKSKYIIGANIRREGSSLLGKNNRFGTFPGASMKWIISDEEFMAPTKSVISMLALRPSWGVTGNAPRDISASFSLYQNYGSYINLPATRPTSLRLSELKWENTSAWNLGMDLGFFDDKYVFDLNVYRKHTTNLLYPGISISSTSGYSSLGYKNVGTLNNDGYEINFYTNKLISKGKFSADVNFNISNNRNTVVNFSQEMLDANNPKYTYSNGEYLSRLENGHSYGSIYGYIYDGVYKYDNYNYGEHDDAPVARDKNGNIMTDENGEPLPMMFAYGNKANEYKFRGGDAKYRDINHDGNIDELDIVYLGNSNPKLNGGFGTTFRYKEFSCNLFFNFRYGNSIINAARMNAENMYTDDNQSIAVNWRWRKDGDDTRIPRALYQKGYNWLGSNRYVEDGSFLRFKYMTFNYSVPSAKLKPIGLDKLTMYLTFNNLLVITKYSGVDPEVGYGSYGVSSDNGKTPRSKDFTLGLTVGF